MAKQKKVEVTTDEMKQAVEKYLEMFGIDLDQMTSMLMDSIESHRQVNELNRSKVPYVEYLRRERGVAQLELLMYLIRKS